MGGERHATAPAAAGATGHRGGTSRKSPQSGITKESAHGLREPHTRSSPLTPTRRHQPHGKEGKRDSPGDPQRSRGKGTSGPPRPAPPPQCRLLRKSRACRSNRRRKSHLPHRPLDAHHPAHLIGGLPCRVPRGVTLTLPITPSPNHSHSPRLPTNP